MTCLTDSHFINEIRFNPGEMIHPLIYADWLEEQGDPKSELVRKWVAAAESDDPDVWRGAVEEIVGLREPWSGVRDDLIRKVACEVAWKAVCLVEDDPRLWISVINRPWLKQGPFPVLVRRGIAYPATDDVYVRSAVWCCYQGVWEMLGGPLTDLSNAGEPLDYIKSTSAHGRRRWALGSMIHASFNLFGFNALPGSFREEIGDL